MCCQCNYKSNIRTDCIHYHCEHDMGASIDCCTLRGLGDCPCTKDCSDYVDKAEVYRLGLEALKQPKIIHCNECVYGEQDEEERWYCRGVGCQIGGEDGSGFCSDAERKN